MHRHTLVRAMRAAGLAALASTSFAPAASAAPTTHLLKKLVDATQDGVSTSPAPFTAGENTYFIGNDGTHGNEPWVLTPSGAFMLADLNPGRGESGAREFTSVGGVTYFRASNGSVQALYRTQGTTASTEAVTGAPSNPGNVTGYEGDLYLSGGGYSLLYRQAAGSSTFDRVTLPNATETQYVEELIALPERLIISTYEFSNTADPRRLIAHTAAGDHTLQWAGADLSVTSSSVVRSGDRLFFTGTTADGPRTFASDGTDAGTHIIELPGGAAAEPDGALIAGEPGHAIFRQGTTWYDTDGSTTTAVGVAPTNVGQRFYLGGKLYYVLPVGNENPTFAQPLTSPTAEAVQIRTSYSTDFVKSDGIVYFKSRLAPDSNHWGMFRTDGSLAGTERIGRATEFSDENALGTLYPNAGGGLIFAGTSPLHGRELHRSTGTPGTPSTLVADVNTTLDDADIEGDETSRATFGGRTLFRGQQNREEQLWITDGTTAGTNKLLPDVDFGYLGDPLVLGNGAVFTANPDDDDTELWITDGNDAGTRRISTADGGDAAGGNVDAYQVVGSSIYYTARRTGDPDNSASGIFKSEGSGPGTLVAAPDSWSATMSVRGLKAVGTDLYFAVDDREQSGADEYQGIWKLDTVTGLSTQMTDSTAYFYFHEAVAAGGKLYVPAQPYSVDEWQVWVSDGTSGGTHDLAIEPGTRPYNSNTPVLRTDGTTVLAIAPVGGGTGYDRRLTRIVGTTIDRPTLPTDVTPGNFYAPTNLGGVFYASAGKALVKLGATGDPTIVRAFDGYIGAPAAVHGKLYFSASDAEHGEELWQSDGTTDGTAFLADVLPGTESAWPYSPFQAGERVAFMAWTPATGNQLFAYGEPQAVTATPTPTPAPAPTEGAVPTPTPAPKAADPVSTPTPTPASKPDTRAVPDKVKSGIDEVVETKKRYVFDVSGSVLAPKGLRTRAECKGQVEILITATTRTGQGKKAKTTTKELANVKAKLRWKGGKCTYDKTVTVAKKLVPAGAKLEATVTYRGSSTQKPKTGEPIKINLG